MAGGAPLDGVVSHASAGCGNPSDRRGGDHRRSNQDPVASDMALRCGSPPASREDLFPQRTDGVRHPLVVMDRAFRLHRGQRGIF